MPYAAIDMFLAGPAGSISLDYPRLWDFSIGSYRRDMLRARDQFLKSSKAVRNFAWLSSPAEVPDLLSPRSAFIVLVVVIDCACRM